MTPEAARRDVDLLRAADRADVTITLAGDRVVAALSDTVTPQGIVAVVGITRQSLPDVLRRAPRLVAVLVDCADPGNAGTVIRTADAAGADAVVLAGRGVDPHNPKCVRATAGSLFHLPVLRHPDPADATALLRAAGLRVLATTLDGEDLDALPDDVLDEPTAWLLGSEAHGLPADVAAAADRRIRIPIHGAAESLNLAVAAGLCLYASARRQRTR